MDSPRDWIRRRIGETSVFASPARRRRFLRQLLVLAVAGGVAAVLLRDHVRVFTDPRALRTLIGGYGPLAPAVLVVVQALQVVVAPVPGQALGVVAGYLFGAWWGTLYNLIGITLGSTAAFWLSRRYGREYVERTFHRDALARFDAFGEAYGEVALFTCFLIPGLPDDVLCFAGGLTEIPLRRLVLLAVVGRAPAFFVVNVVGDLLGTGRLSLAGVIAGLFAVVSLVAYRYRDAVMARLRSGSVPKK
jgi:uncharacterized membrane protein YdjX (TVP38/TMEM64 family)